MNFGIIFRFNTIIFILNFLVLQKSLAQNTKNQQTEDALKYQRQVITNQNYARERSQRAATTFTPSKSTSSNNYSSSSSGNDNISSSYSEPSYESRMAFDQAKKRYDANKAEAKSCICSTAVYSEARFIYTLPKIIDPYTGFKNTSQKLWDDAAELNNAQLLKGYLLKIKSNDKQVVIVESVFKGRIVWNPYIVHFDKYSNYNKGIPWSEYWLNIEVPGLYNSRQTDKVKYIESAIVKKQEEEKLKIVQKNAEIEEQKYRAWQSHVNTLDYFKSANPYFSIYVYNTPGTNTSVQVGIGCKLDISGYKLLPGESYAMFVDVSDLKFNPKKGIVYKLSHNKSYQYPYYELSPFLEYDSIQPDYSEAHHYFKTRYKKIERLIHEKLGLITSAESERLKKEEAIQFRENLPKYEIVKKKEEDEKIRYTLATERDIYKFGKRYEYINGLRHRFIGDTSYTKEKNGLGILFKYEWDNPFHGSFKNDKPEYGIGFESGSVKRLFFPYPSIPGIEKVEVYIHNNDLLERRSFIVRGNGEYNSTWIYKNGDVYWGKRLQKFSNEQFGVISLANGDIYSGEFKDSLFHGGNGIYLKADGGIYRGPFRNGVRHGDGVEIDLNGNAKGVVYENGILTTQNSKQTNIEFWNGKYGEIRYPSGEIYRGELKQGRRSGNGVLLLSNGDVACGYFSSESQAGFNGIIRSKTGTVILGEFRLPENFSGAEKYLLGKNAYLIFYTARFANGDIYFGNVSETFTREGFGVCYNTTGEFYAGNYTKDMRSSIKGILVNPYNYVYKGELENNKMNGKGEFIDAQKLERYDGSFKDGERDGEGILFRVDGTSKKLLYKNGVLQQ